MTIGTLCSGIGGIDLGFEKAGFECKFVVEIDKSCQNILRRHFPSALMLSDMTECGSHNLPKVDVLAGGTPCQGFSVAGLRGSLADDRSNLCLQFCRIADELEPTLIVWENVVGCLSTKDNAFGCFLAALVGADAPLVPPRTIDRWNKDKDGNEYFSWPNAGVVAGPTRTAAWRVLDSQYFGVPQRRERVFVVADTLGGCSPQILFESEGVRRHSPPSREAGQGTAGTPSGGVGIGGYELSPPLTSSARGTNRAGESRGQDCVIPILEPGARTGASSMDDPRAGLGIGEQGDLMFTLQASKQHGVCCANNTGAGFWTEDDKSGCLRVSAAPTQPQTLIAGTVSSKWAKGTGGPSGDECQNLVAFHPQQDPVSSDDGSCHALGVGGDGGATVAIAFDTTQITSKENRSNPKEGDPCHPLAKGAHPPAIAFKPSHYTRDKDGAPSEVYPPLSADADKGDQDPVVAFQTRGSNVGVGEISGTIGSNADRASGSAPMVFQTRIARNGRGQPEPIVPALSGADAGATSDMRPCIASKTMVRRLTPIECARLQAHPNDWATWGIDANGNRIEQSDSQQYRQYGNGVTATVLEWIAKRAAKHLRT